MNKLPSITVDSRLHDEDLQISADYISAIGHSVMLKEKFDEMK